MKMLRLDPQSSIGASLRCRSASFLQKVSHDEPLTE
jgi:hypothetical protein